MNSLDNLSNMLNKVSEAIKIKVGRESLYEDVARDIRC